MNTISSLSTTVLVIVAVVPVILITDCVNNCTGMTDGDYNSCEGCDKFVKCSGSTLTKTQCPGGTFFDKAKGICAWQSDTCTETDTAETSQTSPIQAPTTVAQALEKIHEKSFHFIKDLYQSTQCLSNSTAFKIATVRSKIDCASNCRHTSNCWYFLYRPPQCLQYALTSRPCFVDSYKYNG